MSFCYKLQPSCLLYSPRLSTAIDWPRGIFGVPVWKKLHLIMRTISLRILSVGATQLPSFNALTAGLQSLHSVFPPNLTIISYSLPLLKFCRKQNFALSNFPFLSIMSLLTQIPLFGLKSCFLRRVVFFPLTVVETL